jgi:biopolymer transport protein ExbD
MDTTDGSDSGNESPAALNALPDPATFSAPDDAPPRSGPKPRRGDEPGGLSITSLMDIMTIILVFLLKSYSSSPIQLKQAKDLKPPESISMDLPIDSTTITLTLNNILVNDEPVLDVREGKLGENDVSGGGFQIDRLFDKLKEELAHERRIAARNPTVKPGEYITIISDRHVPYKLVMQAVYTAGQAEYSKFKFAVVKKA